MELVGLALVVEVVNMWLCSSGAIELIGIGHDTWGDVWLTLNCASSGPSSAAACQVLPRRYSVACDHAAQPHVRLVLEHVVGRSLGVTALGVALWLAVVIEVIEKKRCLWFNILRKKLLNLLVFAKRNLERASSNSKVSCSSCCGQWNIILVFWAVFNWRSLDTGFLLVLPLVRTLAFLWLLLEVV